MIELNWGEILVTDNGRFHLTKSSGTFETGARIPNFMADVWKIRELLKIRNANQLTENPGNPGRKIKWSGTEFPGKTFSKI